MKSPGENRAIFLLFQYVAGEHISPIMLNRHLTSMVNTGFNEVPRRIPLRSVVELGLMNLIARMAIPCLLATVAFVGPAVSADYDPPLVIDAPEAVDEFVPVEVGSGWYLRGDVGYPMNKPFRHSSVPMGAGTFEDETSLLTGSVGMGYQFNSFLRAELNASILPSNRFARVYSSNCTGTETTIITDAAGNPIAGNINNNASRPCMGSDEARNKAYNIGASGFVDLGTFIGFTPYVGGGVGVTYNKSSLSAGMKDCVPTTNTTGFTSVDFACDRPVEYAGTRTPWATPPQRAGLGRYLEG
jgi:opacity protein-like surface antigen